MGKLRDYRRDEIDRRNREVQKIAKRAAISAQPKSRTNGAGIPPNLCQAIVAEERKLSQLAMRRFERARRAGAKVRYITICHPSWTCAAGALTPQMLIEARNWTSRRARNLSKFGQQRVLGFVDVAWVERGAIGADDHWCVHVHFLVYVRGRKTLPSAAYRSAFGCLSDGDRVKRPIFIKTPPSGADLARIHEYCSRALLLQKNQCRRYLLDSHQRPSIRKLHLVGDRMDELARVINQLGPKPLWVLSGLRRKHGKVCKHNARRGR